MSINSLTSFGVPGQNGERSAVLHPKFSHLYRVVFYNLGAVGETAPYDMTRAIKSVSRPSVKFGEQALYSYVSTVYLPTRAEWDPITIRLHDDIDNTAKTRVQQQMSKQFNFFDQTSSRAGQNFKFEIDIDILAGGAGAGQSASDPNIIEKICVVGAYITSVDQGDLNYEDTNPMEISLEIRFDNAITFDHNGNRMGTFDHSPEIDGQIGDFSTGVGGIL